MTNIKKLVAGACIIRPVKYKSGVPIWLITDASLSGCGAWVGQGDTPETARPAALHSRKFTDAQHNYGTTDKEGLAIVHALSALNHILRDAEFTIITDYQPLTRLKGANELSGRRIRWRNLISSFTAKIVYRPGKWNYLADALSCLHEEPDNSSHDAKDPTEEDETDTTPIYALFSRPQDLQVMSRYEPLPVFGHSECGSDCCLNEVTERDDIELEEDLTGDLSSITEALRVPTTTGPVSTDGWKDNENYHSARSNDEIKHSALHWTTCKDEHCECHGIHNTYRERTVSGPCSLPIVYPELAKSSSASPPLSGSPVSTRSRPDLSVLKRRLENAVLCNQTMHQECNEPNCPAHRPHGKRPLYSSALTHSNATISAIEPPDSPIMKDNSIRYMRMQQMRKKTTFHIWKEYKMREMLCKRPQSWKACGKNR